MSCSRLTRQAGAGWVAVLPTWLPGRAAERSDSRQASARASRGDGSGRRTARLLAESLAIGSVAANMAGDRASARRLLDESQVAAEGVDDVAATLAFLQARSLDGFFEGDLDTVRASSSEGVRLSWRTGDTYGLETLLINLGSAALLAGELDQAQPLLAEALRISHEIDDRWPVHPARLVGLPCRQLWPGAARGAAARSRRSGANRGWRNLIPTVALLVAGAEASAIASAWASASRPSSTPKAPEPGRRNPNGAWRAGPCRRRDSRRCGRGAAREAGSRRRAVGRRGSEQQADRSAPVHLRADRRQPRSAASSTSSDSTCEPRSPAGWHRQSVARRRATALSIAGRGPRRGGPSRARPDASQLTPGRSFLHDDEPRPRGRSGALALVSLPGQLPTLALGRVVSKSISFAHVGTTTIRTMPS